MEDIIHMWIKQNGEWCISSVLTLSTLHISPALEVKQPYVREMVACVACILSVSWAQIGWASICLCLRWWGASRPLGRAILSSADNKREDELCQHCGGTLGDFPQIKAHFLVQIWFRTRWYEAHFSAELRAALCDSTDLVVYSSAAGAARSFYLLTSPRQSVNPPAELPF